MIAQLAAAWGTGLYVGLLVAAAIGPVAILCIRETIAHGWRAGMAVGMGAAVGDGLFGAVAAFAFGAASAWVAANMFWLQPLGGALLLALGVSIARAPTPTGPAELAVRPRMGRVAGLLVGTFALVLVNPLTILTFAALFTGLGVAGRAAGPASAGALVLGVFLGSALWWVLLTGAAGVLRARLDAHVLGWLNRGSAVVIGLFGVYGVTRALV